MEFFRIFARNTAINEWDNALQENSQEKMRHLIINKVGINITFPNSATLLQTLLDYHIMDMAILLLDHQDLIINDDVWHCLIDKKVNRNSELMTKFLYHRTLNHCNVQLNFCS